MDKFEHSDWQSIVPAFQSNGFVIIKGLLQDSRQLDQLRHAADLVTIQTRQQLWPYKRTVGKQFPPWNDESPDVWGVQHIMHPDLQQRVFAALYFSPQMVTLTAHLSGQSAVEHPMAGLLNLLVEPQDHHFGLDWHRDSIKSSVGQQEEQERLRAKAEYGGVQWNLALYADECLFAVPGSHLRPRTMIEREITIGDPAGKTKAMPGGICVRLEAGEAVFYDPQILHRGTYNQHAKRRTLHGAHLDCRADIRQASGILQHFKQCGMFYGEPTFLKCLPDDNDLALVMARRTVDWATRAQDAGLVEFAQDDI